MKIQFFLTITTIALTAGYILLTLDSVDWSKVSAIEKGTTAGFIGAIIFAITGIGLGWVGCAADYSRYLPRTVSGKAVVGWTIFGASIVPIVLVIYGSLLAASSDELNEQVATDPIGALTTLLPTWYLIPFAMVAILGLIGGAILDLYSSGLVLVSIGLPVKRYVAASIDGAIMTIGTIYLVWFASDFFVPFQGFLITLGVPVAVWSGLFVADVLLRKSYAEKELFDVNGRYGAYNFKSIGLILFGASIVPIVLVIYGSLLAASSDELNQQVATDPIGALTTLLPTWYLIPFAFVAILGLIGGAILDLYSSGLVLVSIGLPVKRYVAASIDGLIMT